MSNCAEDGCLADLGDRVAELVKNATHQRANWPTQEGQRRAQIVASTLSQRSQLRGECNAGRIRRQFGQIGARFRLFVRKMGERRLVRLISQSLFHRLIEFSKRVLRLLHMRTDTVSFSQRGCLRRCPHARSVTPQQT